MPNQKIILRALAASLAASISLAVTPLRAETTSDSERLQKLERAVEQLQKRNAELEKEVKNLKKQTALAPIPAEGPTKKQVTYDGKTLIEKNVVAPEKPPVYVLPRG